MQWETLTYIHQQQHVSDELRGLELLGVLMIMIFISFVICSFIPNDNLLVDDFLYGQGSNI